MNNQLYEKSKKSKSQFIQNLIQDEAVKPIEINMILPCAVEKICNDLLNDKEFDYIIINLEKDYRIEKIRE